MWESKNGVDELFRQMDRMRKAWVRVNPSKTLNKSQFATLFTLARLSCQAEGTPSPGTGKPITISELASVMHQSLPSLSQRVTALEEKGFVERVADPADRRVTGLLLTETGRREMEAAHSRFNAVLWQAAHRVGEEDMETLLRLLGELAAALEETADEQTNEGTAPKAAAEQEP